MGAKWTGSVKDQEFLWLVLAGLSCEVTQSINSCDVLGLLNISLCYGFIICVDDAIYGKWSLGYHVMFFFPLRSRWRSAYIEIQISKDLIAKFTLKNMHANELLFSKLELRQWSCSLFLIFLNGSRSFHRWEYLKGKFTSSLCTLQLFRPLRWYWKCGRITSKWKWQRLRKSKGADWDHG